MTAFVVLVLTNVIPSICWADIQHNHKPESEPATQLEKVEVTGVKMRLEQAGVLKNVIQQTELISQESIEKQQANTLAEAIQKSPGVRVANECSMCGVKRVLMNGMKGEHTTTLIDGIPMYTLISGFYGFDASSAAGIESIEIARGAGASLVAPEAIGGTINLITREAKEDLAEVDIAGGENGYRKTSILATGVSDDGNTRATLVGQQDTRDQYDGDDNGVSESPSLKNASYVVRISHDIGTSDNVTFRLGNVRSEIFGGPKLGSRPQLAQTFSTLANGPTAGDFFVDGDVRNQYIANPWETAEWIKTDREELALSWLHEINEKLNATLSLSTVEHIQDSFYEGIDYYADNKMSNVDLRFNYFLSQQHLLTFGANIKRETLRSENLALQTLPDYVTDSFDYDTDSVYVQDVWKPIEALEISGALRYDNVKADFIDPAKPGIEIEESIVSPRLDIRYMHTEHWASRLSAGRGYRAPLSFFESDHGILDSGLGYQIEVDKLERSLSMSYALSYESDVLTTTASYVTTSIDNLAALSETDMGVPLLTQLDETAKVNSADIVIGYRIIEPLTLSATLEQLQYDDVFKQSFSIAPIERRASLGLDLDINAWDLSVSATWVGSRDLTDYGYEGYNRSDATAPKTTDAPAYTTVDAKVSYEFAADFSLYLGATNLFDYTQVGDSETPLFYDATGGYDVAYIYGPLRGREAYVGMKLTF
ncbi:MAG: TonB-dependent receptor [Gammaproteobacteria bacterium]|nr:TonB-dependent receptor [Gammaproteobacteria bacterium]